eukprot:TRINITY_DN29147_c0_g1_i2.p1 TRINITY_DN29147_c0_g1~~TRINITY_DN29147_c0_g1_i2.p1  ORF type:complete len:271 (-),score=37.03 TRINITY_DN29147_c0_g1_i2:42-854(-)
MSLSARSQVERKSKAMPLFRVGVDFRVKNTFIELTSTQKLENKIMRRCLSWDGFCNPASASVSESSCHSHEAQEAIPFATDLAQSYQPRNLSINDLDPRDPVQSLVGTGIAISHALEALPESDTDTKTADAHRSRRPSKHKRRLCTQMMKCVISFYSHDEDKLSQIASVLAARSSYLRGLCLKYKIPLCQHRGQEILLQDMPRQFQIVWAQLGLTTAAEAIPNHVDEAWRAQATRLNSLNSLRPEAQELAYTWFGHKTDSDAVIDCHATS